MIFSGSDGKESACNLGDPGSIGGLGRSSGEGNGTPFQDCCLENPMDRGAWRAIVHGSQGARDDWETNNDHSCLLGPSLWSLTPWIITFRVRVRVRGRWYGYPHFPDEEKEARVTSDNPWVTQLAGSASLFHRAASWRWGRGWGWHRAWPAKH